MQYSFCYHFIEIINSTPRGLQILETQSSTPSLAQNQRQFHNDRQETPINLPTLSIRINPRPRVKDPLTARTQYLMLLRTRPVLSSRWIGAFSFMVSLTPPCRVMRVLPHPGGYYPPPSPPPPYHSSYGWWALIKYNMEVRSLFLLPCFISVLLFFMNNLDVNGRNE